MGQLLLMSAVAVVTGIGLAALDVPLALALALLAGLLEFIPYIGPLVAAVPALLVALGESPALAGWVLLLYIGIQAVEGNLLQPLVQQRAVYLAPALILLGQLVFGILAGPLGIVLATPLAASALVTVRMLYIEDVLGEK
jgi:predicted PurR-regulated permease PerM